jgi:prevent-host-death family protein
MAGLEVVPGFDRSLARLRLSLQGQPMEVVNIHQAKTHLSQLLLEVEQGKEVVIARSGVPIARLVAWRPPTQAVASPGAMRGQIAITEDFDAPLDGLFEALQ